MWRIIAAPLSHHPAPGAEGVDESPSGNSPGPGRLRTPATARRPNSAWLAGIRPPWTQSTPPISRRSGCGGSQRQRRRLRRRLPALSLADSDACFESHGRRGSRQPAAHAAGQTEKSDANGADARVLARAQAGLLVPESARRGSRARPVRQLRPGIPPSHWSPKGRALLVGLGAIRWTERADSVLAAAPSTAG